MKRGKKRKPVPAGYVRYDLPCGVSNIERRTKWGSVGNEKWMELTRLDKEWKLKRGL